MRDPLARSRVTIADGQASAAGRAGGDPSALERTCGGRGPAVVGRRLATRRRRRRRRWRRGRRAGAAAGRASRASRSIRRSALRRGSARRAGAPVVVDRPAQAGQRHDRVPRAVQGRPDELGHAGVEDDLAAAAVADVQDAGDEPAGPGDEARPGSIARRVGRRSAGDAVEQRRQLAGEARRGGRRLVERRTGNPPPTSSVSNVSIEPRQSAVDRERRAGRRRARHRPRPSCEPTCRWMPRGRSGPSGPPPRLDGRRDSVSVIPNLEPPGADREPGEGLRRDVGVEPEQDVERGPPPRRDRSRPVRVGLVGRLDRDPARAGRPLARRPDRGPQVGGGLADPSRVIRSFGQAGPAGGRPLAARDDVGAEPARGDRGDDRRDVVGLDRVLAQPRIREGVADGRGRGSARAARSVT